MKKQQKQKQKQCCLAEVPIVVLSRRKTIISLPLWIALFIYLIIDYFMSCFDSLLFFVEFIYFLGEL